VQRLAVRPKSSHAGPFDLGARSAYERWREGKLHGYPHTAGQLVVEVRDPLHLTAAERGAILERCRKANAAILACQRRRHTDKRVVRRLGEQFGLRRLDGNLCADGDSITSLRATSEGRQQAYIPYSNRPLSWHTDGYYNPPSRQIRGFILLCVQDAASGGESALFDHEMAYLLMRDEDPAYVAAFMEPDAMTIPANVEEGCEIRGAQTGPVFSIDSGSGSLHMRYTARKRNIEWRRDPTTQRAVDFLTALLANSPRVLRHRLEPGQGVICNNVLHNRTGFVDDAAHGKERLVYRARYYDRIQGTDGAPGA
jgi:alpha-ketoglutarate-dependent taurine dioxygenase